MDADPNVQISPSDRDVAIRTMLGEEGAPEAQAGVASVILNRAQSGNYGGRTPSEVALARSANGTQQFEPWGSRAKELWSIQQTDPRYVSAGKIFDSVASGETPDFTNGATHFYAPVAQKALGRAPPAWASGDSTSLGQTMFYSPQGAVHYKAPASQAIQAATSDQGKKKGGDEPDIVDQFTKPMPSAAPAPTAAAPTAAKASAASEPDIVEQFTKPMPNAPVPDGAAPGSYPFGDPRNQGRLPTSYTDGSAINAATDDRFAAVDPSAPLSQNLRIMARKTGNYLMDQVTGVPGAIANAFQGGTDAAALGKKEMAEGNYLPTMTSPGGILTNIGGHVAQLASPLTGLTNQFVSDPVTQATGSPAIGENAGIVANSLVGPVVGPAARMIRPAIGAKIIGDVSPETATLAQTARNQYGIPVNAAQMSSSPAVRFTNSMVSRLPFSGAGPDAAAAQGAFNKAVANSFGEDAAKVTPQVMASAKNRIGNELDNIQASSSTRIDPKFVTDIHNTLNDAQSVLPPDEVTSLRKQVGKIYDVIDPRTGTISGESYQALTRQGTPLSQLQGSSNPNTAFYAGKLRDALDDAMERSAPPGIANRLREARSQYRNMKTVEDLAAKSPDGDISPAALMQKVSSKFNTLAYGGGGDLGDLARIGQKFLKEPPSSGTAERLTLKDIGKTLSGAGVAMLGLDKVAPSVFPTVAENAGYAAAAIPPGLALGRATGATLRSNWLANDTINRALGRGPILAPRTEAGAVIPSAGAGIGAYVSNRFSPPQQPTQ